MLSFACVHFDRIYIAVSKMFFFFFSKLLKRFQVLNKKEITYVS